ncbi:HNH endonuclease signature motif containing protein [Microbacterium mangrovi]|uniref:HNH endonuclease signature motif containing protein n=1 Tax=Microbacterium mangrovi TaxID=1348253 RepID=UPI000691FAC7|nr:HNH endonuclease signature motif containing protein [Microbacterium mangrovi]
MADTSHDGLSPVLSDLDVLVDGLGGARARVAAAFGAETRFYASVAALVDRRERERAQQADTGAVVSASQLAMREIYAEIAAAVRLSEYQVASRVNQAHVLVSRFATTMSRVDAGVLSPQHATTIADVGGVIDDPHLRAEYEEHAIDLAGELTPAQLKDALGVLVDRLDPDGTQQRVRDAVARRSVRKRTVEPGVGQLIITGPTAHIEGTYNRLTDIATELHTANQADTAAAEAAEAAAGATEVDAVHSEAGDDADAATPFAPDERTRAQIMADVALDLLLTNVPDAHGTTPEHRDALGAIQATVHLTIPASTLAGTTTGGATAEGGGLVDDDTARTLAGGSDDWYRIFTDPTTGVPVTVDKRRPCTAMKRLLQARDETCRFPGCRRPAKKCDIDHTTAHAEGGPTALCNLACLCERHHTVKHHTDWTVQQLPGGILHFTSPTRRGYRTRPPAAVRFTPDRPPGQPSRPPGAAGTPPGTRPTGAVAAHGGSEATAPF